MFLIISEFAGVVITLLVIVTQLVVPLWQDKPIFPAFRRRRRKLAQELSRARGSVDEALLRNEIKDARGKVREIERGSSSTSTDDTNK